MSDAAATGRVGRPADDGPAAAGPLTADAIERLLTDFRRWLQDLASGRREPAGESGHREADAPRSPDRVDLFTLVAQFTALRHEVNLQTKATRAAVEQTAKLVEYLEQPEPPPDDEPDRPLLKSLIDIADVLAVSARQTARTAESAAPPPPPGFFARLFGPAEPPPDPRPLLQAAANGYAMSLRRVERALEQAGLEPIACTGEQFDPETMEVVELTDVGPPGSVIEEVRRGYRLDGKVFRFAQVRVAR